MNYEYRTVAKSRRVLYRESKRVLYRALVRRWGGSREALRRRIWAFLRGRDRGYLLCLVRRQGFALAVAGAILSGGAAHALPAVELSDLAANGRGFVINGIDQDDHSGRSVSGAGDVNGDGRNDLIVGARGVDHGASSNAGDSYVVFGKAGCAAVELSAIAAGVGGFVMRGIAANDGAGLTVSDAGDVNGDGLADLFVGSGDHSIDESYVVFGKADGAAVELSSVVSGTGGFAIKELEKFVTISGAGDVNGDGLADLVIGAYAADVGASTKAGKSYVVFGKTDGATVELSTVAAGTGGFLINGIDPSDYSGLRVSGAGDVNGDGLADLIISAPFADPGGRDRAGESYVVFGKADGTVVDLSTVALGTGGFVINGVTANDRSGYSVSGAGDVNGDGFADVIIGVPSYDLGSGGSNSGASYVVFGKVDGAAVELSTVAAGTGGFVINGVDAFDRSGESVSGAGDVNGDGLADLIVGAYRASPGGRVSAGESYVVFGKVDGAAVELSTVAAGIGGFAMNGISNYDFSGWSVSGAGDVNGDGMVDLILGARGAASNRGRSYVVFAAPPLTTAWVDFAFVGCGSGLQANPYSTLQDALDNVVDGGTITIKGNTATSTSSETPTISKAVTITAVNGVVTIGSPGAPNAQDRTGGKAKGGFVSGSLE